MDVKRFRELAKEHLGPLAQRQGGGGRRRDWSITLFARSRSSVSFGEGKFTVTIRGQEFYADGETHSAR